MLDQWRMIDFDWSVSSMFSLIAGAYELWAQRPTFNILIIGLDGAGKTSLIVAQIEMKGCNFKFWDLGGNQSLQSIWKNYYADSHAVIFVVDGNDWKRMEAVRDCFKNVTRDDDLDGIPVLLLLNKTDLLISEELIIKVKELFNPVMLDIGARECKLFTCSALKKYNRVGVPVV